MKIWPVVAATVFALAAGALVYSQFERPSEQVVREMERVRVLQCWHEVVTSRVLNPGECRQI